MRLVQIPGKLLKALFRIPNGRNGEYFVSDGKAVAVTNGHIAAFLNGRPKEGEALNLHKPRAALRPNAEYVLDRGANGITLESPDHHEQHYVPENPTTPPPLALCDKSYLAWNGQAEQPICMFAPEVLEYIARLGKACGAEAIAIHLNPSGNGPARFRFITAVEDLAVEAYAMECVITAEPV